MNQEKMLFIDRDGTLIVEPADMQVDSIEKLALMPDVIPSLLRLKEKGYHFVMVSNQDGLGTSSLPQSAFDAPHEMMLQIFKSQGIEFKDIKICPHLPKDNCDCRKPKLGLMLDYLVEQIIDRNHSYVIGDRETDMQLANNMGIKGIKLDKTCSWKEIANQILFKDRVAKMVRQTKETNIAISVNLDSADEININTGIGFFDHMLEQLAKHGGFSMCIEAKGDLEVDEHHTVEDVAIVLGEALRKALNDKWGIGRFGFILPMDEALAIVSIDLCGRSYFVFEGEFEREQVNNFSTEMIPHFFRSFSEALKATIHIKMTGENSHHMIEAIFKGVGRALRQAIVQKESGLPSTKGIL